MHDGEAIHPLLLGFKNLNRPTKVVHLGWNYSLFRLLIDSLLQNWKPHVRIRYYFISS